jgi:hypothetical protein
LLRTLLGSLLGSQELQSGNLKSLLSAGMQPRFTSIYNPSQPGFGSAFGQGLGQTTGLAGKLIANYLLPGAGAF